MSDNEQFIGSEVQAWPWQPILGIRAVCFSLSVAGSRPIYHKAGKKAERSRIFEN